MTHIEKDIKKALSSISENVTIPDAFKGQCIHELGVINFSRARWIMALVLVIELGMTVLGVIMHLPRVYLVMYLSLALVSLAGYSLGIQLNKSGKIDRFNNFLAFFLVFSLGWSAAIGVMDELFYNGEITAYVVMIFLFSVTFIIRTSIFVTAQVVVLSAFFAALLFFQIEYTIVVGHFVNILICVIISTVTSRALYKTTIRNMISKMVIGAKNKELESMVAQLHEISATDALTGIYNRRKFNEIIDIEWRRAMRDRRLLSLIIFDIDFFKKYNDYYGHLKGDECLSAVGGMLLKKFKRANEYVSRYGGEEFTIVICDCEKREAVQVCERLIETVAELNIPHPVSGVAPRVTVSAGLASIIPTVEDKLEDFIQRADQALYMAKESGRDGFVVAPDID